MDLPAMLEMLMEENGELWKLRSPRRLAFEALVRYGQLAISKHPNLVVPIFVNHLKDGEKKVEEEAGKL